MQVRFTPTRPAFPSALTSTAYNLDYALSVIRSCYEGRETWLNQFERGRTYAGGDLWGCVGLWFSGRWYYANADYLSPRAGLPEPSGVGPAGLPQLVTGSRPPRARMSSKRSPKCQRWPSRSVAS